MNEHTKRIFELCGILDNACSLIICEVAAIERDYEKPTPPVFIKYMLLLTIRRQIEHWKEELAEGASVDKTGKEQK